MNARIEIRSEDAGSQPVRRGVSLNHNETLVDESKQVRRGVSLNHNETLVADGARSQV